MSAPFAYDAVPYPTVAFRECHPERFATVAAMHGLAAPDVATCSYLELACGDGVNMLSVASSLPGARCVGVDLSGEAIARGAALAAGAGLGNAKLAAADLMALDPAKLGRFDYIAAHGLISWAPAAVRERFFALCGELLTENGVAFVSFNALPGWAVYAVTRGVTMPHAASAPDAAGRRAAALERLALIRELHGEEDIYDTVLSAGERHIEERATEVLFHDELSEICEPLWLDDVLAMAAPHGLAYLDEARFEHWWRWGLPGDGADRVAAAAGDDPVACQRLADEVAGRGFKMVLLRRAGAECDARAATERAIELSVAAEPAADAPTGDDGKPIARDAVATSALERLVAARPAAMTVRELAASLEVDPGAGAEVALRLCAGGEARLHVHPPTPAAQASDRPETTPLSRRQAAAGPLVTTLRHGYVRLNDPLARLLVVLLDGSRDRPALVRDLTTAAVDLGAPPQIEQQLAAGIDGHLQHLADVGLLLR